MLYCPNHTCQTLNPETHKFCQKCRTPLPHRYLWAIGSAAERVSAGEMVGDRYLCQASRIFLDTQPGSGPIAPPGHLPLSIDAYLRLSPYRLHIPQVYDLVKLSEEEAENVLILLDNAALQAPNFAANAAADAWSQVAADVQLLPLLTDAFPAATPLRQIYWLWQIASLWHPLDLERVAASLLTPGLLRVEGPIVHLQELVQDTEEFSLVNLGKCWSDWAAIAHATVRPFLLGLGQQLQSGQIHTPDLLIQQLDQEIERLSQFDTLQLTYLTLTDQGPSRQRNEDACYPAAAQVYQQTLGDRSKPAQATPYLIVCDGIGGHQGGDVASQLAIEAIQQRLQTLRMETLAPAVLTRELEVAVCIANDLISQRNDSEQRYDRQRMGTTLVLAVIRGNELYITHVGDSRAYWITAKNCYQVTLDDDVASREVRLGYSFYREALQTPNSGSLVQALGMNPSAMLHPTVQRFVLDEDAVFLLCTDGLSDNDRVEQFWDVEVLPLLQGQTDIVTVGQRLVAIANSLNGHDNVTVGLLHCKVISHAAPTPATWEYPSEQEAVLLGSTRLVGGPAHETQPTAVLAPASPKVAADKASPTRFLAVLTGVFLLLLGGVWALRSPLMRDWFTPADVAPTPSPSPEESALPVHALLQVGRATSGAATIPLTLYAELPPGGSSPLPGEQRLLLQNTILKVTDARQVGGDRWLQLVRCPAMPTDASGLPSPGTSLAQETDRSLENGPDRPLPFTTETFTNELRPGEQVWVKESELSPFVRLNPSLTAQQETCGEIGPSPIPSAPTPQG